MKISHNFDAGNIEVVTAENSGNIRLRIRKDHQSDFYQWFCFRLTGGRGQLCAMTIENAAGAAYPEGWTDYQACASYDREHWFRVSTVFHDGEITLQHIPESDSIYYAYFAPYSMERHHSLVSQAAADEKVRLQVIGETLDGQDIDLLTIGDMAVGKKVIWIIARQHPGETMAEWLVEGLLERLLDDEDALSHSLLNKAVFYVVPNMNPDGSRRGHLRTNACGANLNREWQNPSLEHSPEVFHVRGKMDETGIDLVLDVHGDETLPHNFIACFEGITDPDMARLDLAYGYQRQLMQANPDFQMTQGYPKEASGTANMTIGTNQLAQRFQAVAMTLEMPFKDTLENPDSEHGWSPERCRKLGRSNLDALASIIDRL
ncbi:MAG: carboxypeptidase family protein [Alphaproteobacteria bacterium]|nr:carboxypeptidase family protein [Alphaproteobacteria bacterium]